MQWQEIQFNIHKKYLEFFSDQLLAIGAVAITETAANQEAVFQLAPDEQPKWQEITLTALFTIENDIQTITSQISTMFKQCNLKFNSKSLIINILPDLNWEESYKQYLNPVQFGKKLWICPSWKAIPDPNAINIILDPGQAFGTGSHATTALCLNWLEQHIQPNANTTLIDYGCGSGILAISALKLGASTAYAVDIDPKAIAVTKDNAAINAVPIYSCLPEDPILQDLTVDLVIANILANPLTILAPTLSNFLKPNGIIVLSGILNNQIDLIISYYSKYFTNFSIQQEEDWVRIVGKKI